MSNLFRSAALRALLALALISPTVAAPSAVLAQATTFLNGEVTLNGKPVTGAAVTVTGGPTVLHGTTDARGRFAFPQLTIGTYTVLASHNGVSQSLRVDLATAGADVTIALDQLREIGRTNVTVRSALGQRSGGDTILNNESITRNPRSGSLPELLLQVPGAARGANGVVHINGDHANINYVVDGVPLPIELNRVVGNEFDPTNLQFAEVLEGAYPAQYGERFAAVVNIGTLANSGPAGASMELKAGSFALFDSTLSAHGPLAHGGSYTVAVRNQSDGRALDPPNELGSPHNRGSNTSQVIHFTFPNASGTDFLNFTASHAYQTYQIPVDVQGVTGSTQGPLIFDGPLNGAAAPSAQNDNETSDDIFASVQYRHAIGDRGSLSFGPSIRRSRLRDFGDYVNDTIAPLADPNTPSQPAPGVTGATCANANSAGLAAAGAPTGALADCAFSVNADRTSLDYRFNLDYANRSAAHEVRFGAIYDASNVKKNYDIALQPNNPYSAGRFDVYDTTPNSGHYVAAYLQDAFRFARGWELDYGVRADSFQLTSSQFRDGEGMLSPRVKLSRSFTPRSNVYAYYGRFFTPYSFENVAPGAAAFINPNFSTGVAPVVPAGATSVINPALTNGVGFDLKAQRDSVYELGGFLPVGPGSLGLRVMQKNETHTIDDVSVGPTNLHQDINYGLGRISVQSLSYQQALPRAGRAFFNFSHTLATVKNCETQLLAACIGQALDWSQADHDQHYDVSAGFLTNFKSGNWLTISGEYGSGLSTLATDSTTDPTLQATLVNGYCPPIYGNVVGSQFCKVLPHTTFDVEQGFALGKGTSLAIGAENVFDARYVLTFNNAQGTHFGRPRTVYMKFAIRR